ncbi:MAG: hypothetical protein LUG99_13245 [Lachnospiraceae bacterium]|nr:hypothetical protein [Lachnospiraceae bacterium]
MKVWTSRMLAVSLAGHDKGKLYAVIEELPPCQDGEFGDGGYADGECADAPDIGFLINKESADKDFKGFPVTESAYIFLADGKNRTLEHPKRKKVKHVQLITHLPQPLLVKMSEITLDAHVRKILREYREC